MNTTLISHTKKSREQTQNNMGAEEKEKEDV